MSSLRSVSTLRSGEYSLDEVVDDADDPFVLSILDMYGLHVDICNRPGGEPKNDLVSLLISLSTGLVSGLNSVVDELSVEGDASRFKFAVGDKIFGEFVLLLKVMLSSGGVGGKLKKCGGSCAAELPIC